MLLQKAISKNISFYEIRMELFNEASNLSFVNKRKNEKISEKETLYGSITNMTIKLRLQTTKQWFSIFCSKIDLSSHFVELDSNQGLPLSNLTSTPANISLH